jgi:hypothetical protein
MLTRIPPRLARGALFAAALTAVTQSTVACGTSDRGGMPGMDHGSMPSVSPSHTGMAGMHDMPVGDGLTATASGYTFAPARTSLAADKPEPFTFQIRGDDGRPVTSFADDQTN